MHIRTLLLSGVVFGGLTMLSTVSWAQTAPKVTYNPQGEWAVTRVAAKGPGKEPYCTMARRFSDNVILTFARNAKDETSLAMDFQPNTLAKGQSYYVTLSAGGNEKRAFDVIPVSDKAMVIRMGQDAAFHNALSRSGALDVDVAGLQFEFNMPDMAKGHQDLGGCITSIVEPAAGKPAAEAVLMAPATNAPAAQAAAPAIHDAQLSEMEALKEENMRLKSALERERREYEDRLMQESAGSSQVSEVMEKLKLLEKENGDLKYQLADARSMAEAKPAVPSCAANGDNAAPSADLTLLKEENERLKADIAAQKTAMIELETKLANMPKADDQAVAAADTGTIARLQSRVDELMTQNSELQSDLTAARQTAESLPPAAGTVSISQLRSVEQQLRSVEGERDNLRAQIEKISAGKEDALMGMAGSDWNLEQATRRYNEAEREIRRLGTQLEQSRAKCAAEKKEIEYMLFDPEIATQEQISKLMALESDLTTAKAELSGKDAEVSERISAYEQKIGSYEEQVAALQGQIEMEKAAAVNQSNDEIARAMADKQALEQKVAALQSQIEMEKSAATNQMSVEVARVTAEKQSLEQKVAALQSQIEMEKSAVTNQMGAEIARAIAEKDEVANRLSRVEAEKVALEQKLAAAIEPASGLQATEPPGAIESVSVASVETGRHAGYVSARDEVAVSQPIALAPKSAVPADSFVSTEDVVAPVVAQVMPVAQKVVPGINLVTAEALSGLLRQAGLSLSGDVTKVENASGPTQVAYSWDASGLFGSAEQKTMENPEQFQTMVNQYIEKTKTRCSGDFAASPVPTGEMAGIQVASYEIACISPEGTGATAALVFYGQDGLFTTVAHEAGMDTMDMAMDARDRVISSLASNRITR
ncbi:MAG: hypothetical protein HYS17_06320 [Micavibrio aeruginosavorus]|uniref:Uncharacterized protein n=1 Tax=Micavibrio aeruginosavorus TaxID=349221 RepID=A0A7T5R0G1_9BACT|nr:MAG: hypothetical protein HYS17_06320 [Micavibrio aeruginosavorus]